MSILDEIDRIDGIIECTPQNVAALIAEIRRLRAQNARQQRWLEGEVERLLRDTLDFLRQRFPPVDQP